MSQTDVFAGYQAKNFAWPNLYAARNKTTGLRDERERLQTQLFLVNNRTEFGSDGDYVQAGAYYRGNRDHYAIPVLGYNAHHETVVRGPRSKDAMPCSDLPHCFTMLAWLRTSSSPPR